MALKIRILAALTMLLLSPLIFAEQDPQVLIETTAAKTIAKLKEQKSALAKDPAKLYGLVDEYVLPHFDFDRMSRWVLGKNWRKTNAQQQASFVREFKTLLVRTYATSLADYADQEIKFLPFHGDLSSGDVTVKSEISQPGGFPVPINYRLHKPKGSWKVYDVTIDDISLVANYRSSFATEIRAKGVDQLIKQMAEKNQKAMR